MAFDTERQVFYADIQVNADGDFKIRSDANWGTAYDLGGVNGELTLGGGNIPVTAGNYRIYVNLNNSGNMTYELNAEDYGAE